MTLTLIRPITFFGKMLGASDVCDTDGPRQMFGSGTRCDVLKGNPFRGKALCCVDGRGQAWYGWVAADGVEAEESIDAPVEEFSEPFTLIQEQAITRPRRFRPDCNLHDRSRQMMMFADPYGNRRQPLLFGESLPVVSNQEA